MVDVCFEQECCELALEFCTIVCDNFCARPKASQHMMEECVGHMQRRFVRDRYCHYPLAEMLYCNHDILIAPG